MIARALSLAIELIVILVFWSFALSMKPRGDVTNQSAAA
jgi:hypothetical protein